MRISLAMIVKNEEANLKYCLDSIYKAVDEIIIVDTGSLDKTKEIALEYTKKVYDFVWCNDFSKARNFALDKTTGDWILVLDADEIVLNANRKQIENFITNNRGKIGKIKIISKFLKNGEDTYSKEYVSRLFEKGIKYKGRIHEQLDSNLERIKTDIEVNHSGYFLKNKEDRNIALLFKEYEENSDKYILYQIARTYFVAKKYEKANIYFEKAYNSLEGIENYYPNFIVSYIYSTINLGNFQRGMDLINLNRKILKNSPDFHFACGIFYMNLILSDINIYGDYLYLIEESYIKALELGNENEETIGVSTYKAAFNLGVYYETIGKLEDSNYYYLLSYKFGYKKAKERIKNVKNN